MVIYRVSPGGFLELLIIYVECAHFGMNYSTKNDLKSAI